MSVGRTISELERELEGLKSAGYRLNKLADELGFEIMHDDGEDAERIIANSRKAYELKPGIRIVIDEQYKLSKRISQLKRQIITDDDAEAARSTGDDEAVLHKSYSGIREYLEGESIRKKIARSARMRIAIRRMRMAIRKNEKEIVQAGSTEPEEEITSDPLSALTDIALDIGEGCETALDEAVSFLTKLRADANRARGQYKRKIGEILSILNDEEIRAIRRIIANEEPTIPVELKDSEGYADEPEESEDNDEMEEWTPIDAIEVLSRWMHEPGHEDLLLALKKIIRFAEGAAKRVHNTWGYLYLIRQLNLVSSGLDDQSGGLAEVLINGLNEDDSEELKQALKEIINTTAEIDQRFGAEVAYSVLITWLTRITSICLPGTDDPGSRIDESEMEEYTPTDAIEVLNEWMHEPGHEEQLAALKEIITSAQGMKKTRNAGYRYQYLINRLCVATSAGEDPSWVPARHIEVLRNGLDEANNDNLVSAFTRIINSAAEIEQRFGAGTAYSVLVIWLTRITIRDIKSANKENNYGKNHEANATAAPIYGWKETEDDAIIERLALTDAIKALNRWITEDGNIGLWAALKEIINDAEKVVSTHNKKLGYQCLINRLHRLRLATIMQDDELIDGPVIVLANGFEDANNDELLTAFMQIINSAEEVNKRCGPESAYSALWVLITRITMRD